jgi:methionine aminopeptidase
MEYQISASWLFTMHLVSFSNAVLPEAHRRALQDGDMINIDVTVYLNGWHGDTAATFPVGTVVRPLLTGSLLI